VSKERIVLGNKGEDLAADLLQAKGYKILYRNYRTKLGEIDIVAQEKDIICFVEVKTRSSDRFGCGSEAVLKTKQKQIGKAALCFLKEKKLLEKKARFDVVALDGVSIEPRLNLIKDAFTLDENFSY